MSKRLGLKAILTSLMVMGIVGALIGNGLVAYFNDTETAANNTFTAGTIDIAIWGNGEGLENPWYSGPMSYNMQDLMPSEACWLQEQGGVVDGVPQREGDEGWCEMPGLLDLAIANMGTNTADIWKRVTVTGHDTGILAYPNPEGGPVSSEPEYAAEGALWTGSGWDASGWSPIDNVETATLYDMYTSIYTEEGMVFPVPNPDTPPFIEDEYDCWDLGGDYSDPDGVPGSGDETCTIHSMPGCLVYEDDGVYVDGNAGMDSINGYWMYLGQIEPGAEMYVGQSYRLIDWAGNEYQGDNFTFDIEVFAQQTTGHVSPPQPEWLCLHYGWDNPSDAVEVDFFPSSAAGIQLQLQDTSQQVVLLGGSSTMNVFFEGGMEGDAQDNDGDGLDEVNAELVSLDLTGMSPTLGPVTVTLNPAIPTLGQMEETVNNTPGILDVTPFTPTGAIDSFFDVFVEIDLGGQTLHNATPIHMDGMFTHKPAAPDEWYETFMPVDLLDDNGQPTGLLIISAGYAPAGTGT